MNENPESDRNEEAAPDAQKPEVYALRRDRSQWVLSRRKLLSAAGTAAAGLVGCADQKTATVATAPASDPAAGASAPAQSGSGCDNIFAHTDAVLALAVSPDGRWLASGGADNKARLWSLPEGGLVRTISDHSSAVNGVAFTPDSQRLATACSDGVVRLYAVSDGTFLTSMEVSGTVQALAISGDGGLLVAGEGATIKKFNLADSTPAGTLTVSSGDVRVLAFSPNSKLLACGTSSGSIEIWSVDEGVVKHTLPGHTDAVAALAFNTPTRLLASGGLDDTARTWTFPDAVQVTLIQQSGQDVRALAFLNDGAWLATAGEGSDIRIWTLPGGVQERTLSGHTDQVTALAATPDATVLYSASRDKRIRAWAIPGGDLKMCLMDIDSSPSSAQGIRVETSIEGRTVSYTLPCGSPIPAGAICTCNCVPGTWYTATTCSCDTVPTDTVCTCDSVPTGCSCDTVSYDGGGHYWYPD